MKSVFQILCASLITFQISTAQNVGVGTSNPQNRLHIHTNATGATSLGRYTTATTTETQGVVYGFANSGYNFYFDNTDGGGYQWWISGTERMRITAGGNVGIGLTPAHKFDVAGSINTSTNYKLGGVDVISGLSTDVYGNIRVLQNVSTATQDGMYINLNSAGGAAAHLRFYANGTNERMRIDAANGNVGINNTLPLTLLHVHGGHTTSQMRLTLPASANGSNPNTGEASLQSWVSEPCLSWENGGFGMNVNNDYIGGPCTGGNPMNKINSGLGQSFIRFEPNGGNMRFYTLANGSGVGTLASRERMSINSTGSVTINNLSSGGNAPVFADNNGTLYKSAAGNSNTPIKIHSVTLATQNSSDPVPVQNFNTGIAVADYDCFCVEHSSSYDIRESGRHARKIWMYNSGGTWHVSINFGAHSNNNPNLTNTDVKYICVAKNMVEWIGNARATNNNY